MARELKHTELKATITEKEIDCETTEDLKPLDSIIGQERAVDALRFGLNIEDQGFNIFVSGLPGTGRTTGVKSFVNELAKKKSVPNDWCYVNNFKNSYEPKAIRLKPGDGKKFKQDMAKFLSSVRNLLPRAFTSKDYVQKRENLTKSSEEKKNQMISELKEKSKNEGFVLKQTAFGLFMLPVVDGKILNEEEFMSLEKKERERIQQKRTHLSKQLKDTMSEIRKLDEKVGEDIKNLDSDVALYTIGQLVDEMKNKYSESKEVVSYIENVKEDILDNLNLFLEKDKKKERQLAIPWMKEKPFRKYEVNVVVDNSESKGAPVIIEHNPNYKNLFGKIEKEAQFGILTTDFTMIRNGALHKANGGFLIIPVEELLKNIFSWDSLKIALRDKKIDIEEAGEKFGLVTTKGLKPEPIDLDVKIILIGRPLLYNLLYTYDQDFKKLFKVKADYDWAMDNKKKNINDYAAFICTFREKENLKHLHVSAIAKTIEYGSRLVSDQKKLSTKFSEIGDILFEANYYAKNDNLKYINSSHITRAIEQKKLRSNLLEEKIQEMINRGTILIDIDREVVGQVNGLSFMDIGDYTFGRPSRVTATVGIGREGIVDIERETKLGGPVHSKGVMILSGYMLKKFAQNKPFNLSARLVFEQSYGGVDGDSASSAELYAILSSLAEAPVKQNIAVTGSINQNGQVQAIGGVNEKVEGFYHVCKAKGLNGKQGVLIPESNTENLMLDQEVTQAVKDGKFHVWAVSNIEEGIEILTGHKAGQKDKEGNYPLDSINYRVEKKIKHYLDTLKEFAGPKNNQQK
ncbi:MAG: AAA family ATPase [Actinomycetota bacterium]